ncbi:MAG: stage V sporulation protein AC [Clostridioides sp.]|jgi:stage V sporulation protein AC|nr:stage V sporulation protein AC [Clostridioides sp.]
MKEKGSMKNEEYKDYVEALSPKPTLLKNNINAFVVGGLICMVGQGINDLCRYFLGVDKITAGGMTSMILVFLGALLTGLGIYDLIGKRAGAGSIVPITGFANSIVSPAMEHKQEGQILGIGANLFRVAGPVLVYGIGSSVICGIIYYIFLALS